MAPRRVRVLFLTHHLPWPPQSGGRLRESELLRRLAPRFDIELVAISKSPDLDFAHVADATGHGIHARVFAAQASSASQVSPQVRQHHSPPARIYLHHRLATDKERVLHVEGHYLMSLLPAAAQRRALVVEHNIESILFELRAGLAVEAHERGRLMLDTELTRRAEMTAWRTARMVAAVTAADATVIREAVPDAEVRVLPDGADHLPPLEDKLTPASNGRRRLLFVANLAYHPNKDAARILVTDIFPAILTHCPDAMLTIVGPHPPQWLLDMAANEARMTVTGWVPDVTEWLDAAEVVVCPLRIGGGVKVKILEALARGRAVVTTPIGLQGLRHLPSGSVVECEDTPSMVEQCLALLNSPDERGRQETRALAAARQLPTWDEAADLLEYAWTALASASPTSQA